MLLEEAVYHLELTRSNTLNLSDVSPASLPFSLHTLIVHSLTHSLTPPKSIRCQPSPTQVVGVHQRRKQSKPPSQSGSSLCSDCSPPPPQMPFLFSTQSRLSGLGWGPPPPPLGKLQVRGQHHHLQYPQFTAEVLIQHSLPSHSSGGSPPSPGQMESSRNKGIPPPSSAVVTMLPALGERKREHDHGPRSAESYHFCHIGLQEVGRREKDLHRMRSARKKVRLGRRVRGKERWASGGGKLVASENAETQKQKKE